MKLLNVFTVLAAVSAAPALAQTAPAPVASATPYQFQSQTMMRAGTEGPILVLPAVTTDYKIWSAGNPEPKKYENMALIYEKRTPFGPTQVMGTNYIFFKGNYMATVTADGSLFYKGKMDIEAAVVGGNYFIVKGTNKVVTIASNGMWSECPEAVGTVRLAGGNYFITTDNILYKVKAYGTDGTCASMLTWDPAAPFPLAAYPGGNYFVNSDGTFVTISADGFYSVPYKLDSAIGPRGGNYFLTQDNLVFTVDEKGIWTQKDPIKQRPVFMGYSYMRFADGSFNFFPGNGQVHAEAIRVAPSGKAEYTTQFPTALDAATSFIPTPAR